jgi:hypothetical protein
VVGDVAVGQVTQVRTHVLTHIHTQHERPSQNNARLACRVDGGFGGTSNSTYHTPLKRRSIQRGRVLEGVRLRPHRRFKTRASLFWTLCGRVWQSIEVFHGRTCAAYP